MRTRITANDLELLRSDLGDELFELITERQRKDTVKYQCTDVCTRTAREYVYHKKWVGVTEEGV